MAIERERNSNFNFKVNFHAMTKLSYFIHQGVGYVDLMLTSFKITTP